MPWCVIGDFNYLLYADDKLGRIEHPNYLMVGFMEAVQATGLFDIKLEGYQFTWNDRKGTDSAVEERLDRAMANQVWLDLFPQVRLFSLVAPILDHTPILLQREPMSLGPLYSRFRFENAWLVENDFPEVVRRGWSNETNRDIVLKLK